MFREPWFSIVNVYEKRGRSIGDIAAEVAGELGLSLIDMRGLSRSDELVEARAVAYLRIQKERPDVSSGQIGRYFGRDASVIRRAWRHAESPWQRTRAWTNDERSQVATALRCGIKHGDFEKMFGVPWDAARKRIGRDKELRKWAA
jgi:hypothetical protein